MRRILFLPPISSIVTSGAHRMLRFLMLFSCNTKCRWCSVSRTLVAVSGGEGRVNGHYSVTSKHVALPTPRINSCPQHGISSSSCSRCVCCRVQPVGSVLCWRSAEEWPRTSWLQQRLLRGVWPPQSRLLPGAAQSGGGSEQIRWSALKFAENSCDRIT